MGIVINIDGIGSIILKISTKLDKIPYNTCKIYQKLADI